MNQQTLEKGVYLIDGPIGGIAYKQGDFYPGIHGSITDDNQHHRVQQYLHI